MIPYEVYFYSSGAIEERWGPKDLGLNRANALIGYSLGGLLSFALMISAGALLLPQGINAELLGTVALVAQAPLGQIGLILALVGIALRGLRRRDRLGASPAPTASRSSSAGSGASTATTRARRGSRSPGW